jgi:CDP-diacylglycerol--glycerol-3-phosphate 3-phosphatidyltransferase
VRSTFGPTALLTPANALTLARLLATPVLIAMVAVGGAGWAPFAVALAIGATDAVDGWLARRQGATRSGAFLDPLADKVAVVGVMCALAGKGLVWWAPVVVIAAREVVMVVYRVAMARRGVSIPARVSAKVKTLIQGVAILLALVPPLTAHPAVISAAMWLAVLLTVATGVQYLEDGRRAARDHPGAPPGRLPGGPARPLPRGAEPPPDAASSMGEATA